MPQQEQAARFQDALLWVKVGTDAYGQAIVAEDHCQVRVRWNDSKSESLDPQGTTERFDATVVVDREIARGSVMWQGRPCDLPGTAEIPDSDLFQVVKYNGSKDVKGRATYHEVSLMRLRNAFPTRAAE